ncbi:translin [Physcia stellaris]|nr:translin [Physcia stellaris]
MASSGMVDPAIFKHLQTKIDEDSAIREELRNILQDLEKQSRSTQSILSRAHSIPAAQMPVNLKDRDAFHLTVEEYLHALIGLIEELARLAVNSVTLGDYYRPLEISQFVKSLHAGFQILNLKNDSLRRRTDSIKYNVKRIEDVVYDLSLRNLLPASKPATQS